jgi:hypothetical protein
MAYSKAKLKSTTDENIGVYLLELNIFSFFGYLTTFSVSRLQNGG